MVWDQARAKQLMNELQGMMGEVGGGETPGRWDRQPKQQAPTPGSRRDRAAQGEGWNCTCGFYNFAHRPVCFFCRLEKGAGSEVSIGFCERSEKPVDVSKNPLPNPQLPHH